MHPSRAGSRPRERLLTVPGRASTLIRIAAVVGIFAAAALQGASAHADDQVSFTSCSSPSPSPSPTPTPQPSFTPPPDETPAPGESPSPTPPPQNCVPESGEAIRGERTLQFKVSTDEFKVHIDSVVAYLDSATNDVTSPGAVTLECPTSDEDSSKPGCQSGNAAPTQGIYTFDWDTNTITPWNADYTFRVAAHFVGINHDRTVTAQRVHLLVDNPPQTPGAPHIEVTTSKSVTVGWTKAPEPDIFGYSLFRAYTTAKTKVPTADQFKIVLSTTNTLVRDDVPASGAYWYKLRVTRRSVVTASGVNSALSESSSAGVVTPPAASKKTTGSSRSRGSLGAPVYLTPPGLIPSVAAAPPPVPDAPFSAYLPYKNDNSQQEEAGPPAPEAGAGTDPRGAVLPVAVGAFLVSSALALGRMPYSSI